MCCVRCAIFRGAAGGTAHSFRRGWGAVRVVLETQVPVTLIVVLYRFTALAAGTAHFTGKFTPYMAIVGSLVPIMSLFWPLRMYRALIAETAESGRADLVKLSLQFWIPWAGSGLISAQAFRMETSLMLAGDAFDIGTFVVVLVAWLFSDILLLVAVLRARVFFAKLAPALDAA